MTFPPPPSQDSGDRQTGAAPKPVELTAEEKAALELKKNVPLAGVKPGLLAIGGLFMLLIGTYAPASFMQHFIVFALVLLCWLPGDLECKPCASHAVDGCYKCHFRYNHHRGTACSLDRQII